MLTVGRKEGEQMVIVTPDNQEITVIVHALTSSSVRVSIAAPSSHKIFRSEVYVRAKEIQDVARGN